MKRLILASLAVAAMLASCSKESTMDVSIASTQTPIEFTAYAGSATTKGNPVDTNAEFQGSTSAGLNSFEVAAYLDADGNSTTSTASKYFNFSTVTYTDVNAANTWVNSNEMFWPAYDATLYFGATYPQGAITSTNYAYTITNANDTNSHSLKFDYTVGSTVANQKDIMYSLNSIAFDASTTPSAVNLHFKHALTQIAFTATKDDDIEVLVKGITVCNIIDNGAFTATLDTDDSTTEHVVDGTVADANVDTGNLCTWVPATVTAGSATSLTNYAVDMVFDSDVSYKTVADGATSTALTDGDDALMLIPQTVTAWDATTTDTTSSTAVNSTGSYLAISCTITHADTGTETLAPIADGIIFVPFSSSQISYGTSDSKNGTWAPGYKITYNLDFGGGYTYPDDTATIPDPGTVPDPDDVIETLRPITYTTSVDAWTTNGVTFTTAD